MAIMSKNAYALTIVLSSQSGKLEVLKFEVYAKFTGKQCCYKTRSIGCLIRNTNLINQTNSIASFIILKMQKMRFFYSHYFT